MPSQLISTDYFSSRAPLGSEPDTSGLPAQDAPTAYSAWVPVKDSLALPFVSKIAVRWHLEQALTTTTQELRPAGRTVGRATLRQESGLDCCHPTMASPAAHMTL
eukprot:scaffold20623_cov47-Prasinocladus_malaysianus.AAC.1